MELPASMSKNEEQDMIEPSLLSTTLHSLGKFRYRVVAIKATPLIFAMMMGITTSLPVLAQISPSEHASHHPGSSGSPTTELPGETEAKTSASPTVAATPANPIVQQSEHASHHPGNNATAASGQTESKAGALPVATPVNPMMQMMTPSKTPAGPPGCCGMMATGGKPFYPSLMDFPKLTDEARKYIRSEAVARLGSGAQMITASQAELHHALSTNDAVAAQNALKQVRLGLSFAESGASALEALNESQPPPRIALTWFKREMNISDSSANNGFRDISWFHLASMLLLAAALLTAFIFRWARLRRINSLIQRLTPGNAATLATNIASKPNSSKLPETLMLPPNTEHFVPRPWTGVLRIKRIFDEAPNVKTFRLMEPNLDSMPFTFLPGQYATVISEINGEKVRRSYTISSSPTQRDYIELTVKREQYGLESRHLHDHAIPGDLLEVSAPAGNFFFTGKEANGIVLIAGGVGITPMMSVLRYLTDRSYPKDIHLLYAVNSPSSIIFREECDYLTHRHPNVHIDVIVTSTEGIPWTGSVGLITADFIMKTVPDVAHHRIHLCGPPPMMSAVKAALLELKIPSDQVKTENFAPPKGGPVLNTEPTVTSSDKMPIIPPSSQATITFSKSEKSGKLAPDQSVLEAAEAIGVFIDNECRVGTCGRCKVPLLQGRVTMEVQDALSVDEKASGIILACQAKSPNDLVVEA